MKNYKNIEEFIGMQKFRIQEGQNLLAIAAQEGNMELREQALTMIMDAKRSLNETLKVSNIEEFLDLLDKNLHKGLNLLRKATYENNQQLKQQALTIIKEAKKQLADTKIVLSGNTETVVATNDNMIETAVFNGYDPLNQSIITETKNLTAEQALIYNKVAANIEKVFCSGNMGKVMKEVSLALAYYPQLKEIAPKLLSFADYSLVAEYIARKKRLKGKLKKTSVDGNQEPSIIIEGNELTKTNKFKKIINFSKIKNFSKRALIAFDVKTTKIKDNVVAWKNEKIDKLKEKVDTIKENVQSKAPSARKFKLYATKAAILTMVLTATTALSSASSNSYAKDNSAKKKTESTKKDDKDKEKKSDKKVSKFENLVSNVTYADFLATLATYDAKGNVTHVKDEEVAALGYVLNAGYLSEETEDQLIQNGVISDDPIEVFMETIEARDNINNAMISYDKLPVVNKENTKEWFNNISYLATNEESEKQINTLFESVKTIYTGTEEEAKKELDKFVEFMNNDEPRKDKKDYGFNYADLGTDGKFATFIYAPNFLSKMEEYQYDQDIIDNLQYELDNVADFLRQIGYECTDSRMVINKDGMGYNIGKVYGIEVDKDGNIISYGGAESQIFGGTTTTEQLGGYLEQVISGGSSSETTTTGGGNESVENITGGSNSSTTTEQGGNETVEDVTQGGSSSSTEVEEGKDETITDTTPEGDNSSTEVETPDDEVIIDETPSGDNSSSEVEDEKEEIIEVPSEGSNESVEVETPDDEVIIDGDYQLQSQAIDNEPVNEEAKTLVK